MLCFVSSVIVGVARFCLASLASLDLFSFFLDLVLVLDYLVVVVAVAAAAGYYSSIIKFNQFLFDLKAYLYTSIIIR